MIRADNARPHWAHTVTQFFDHNFMRRAPHPPYAPDLSAIQKILREVGRETLEAGFQEWMIRLQKCIDGNGGYVE
jgi:transposase